MASAEMTADMMADNMEALADHLDAAADNMTAISGGFDSAPAAPPEYGAIAEPDAGVADGASEDQSPDGALSNFSGE